MTEIDFRPISGVFDPRMPLKQSKVSSVDAFFHGEMK
nr:MAG TPA: hypothetical protein [Caudoviricetes sp.]